MTWTKPMHVGVPDPPLGRACHGAAASGHNLMLVFGGSIGNNGKANDDVYALSLSPPPQKITQEIYQDILQSLLDRMQKNLDIMNLESEETFVKFRATQNE